MSINLPPKVRKAVYIIGLVGTPVVGYLRLQDLIGDAEVALWGALLTVAQGLAAINVTEG